MNESILKRHPDNPIISPRDFPGAYVTFNPGQTMFNGKTLLMLPVRHTSGMYRGRKVGGTVHVATSDDGVHFQIDPEPLEVGQEAPIAGAIRAQGIDFRITKIDDMYYVMHPAGGWGTAALLGRTRDFRTFENIDIAALPDNRVPCLFPEKINGLYARLDRPYRVAPNDFHEAGNIWVSYSPDLVFWGRHRPLLKSGYSYWAGTKIGPTPPIKTDAGWLVILHGVSRSCAGHRYCIGAMLLDLGNPERIVGKTHSAILSPAEPYEFNGVVPNVVFPCGAIADLAEDRIRIYYGCADSYVGLASGCLSELIAACKEGR